MNTRSNEFVSLRNAKFSYHMALHTVLHFSIKSCMTEFVGADADLIEP